MSFNPEDFPAPSEGFVVAHFLVVSDQDRSREFYRSILDGKVLFERDPVILKVANSWLILNEGGGPTDDKPSVTLETPTDPDRVSAFLNIRVADIAKAYREWSAKGPRARCHRRRSRGGSSAGRDPPGWWIRARRAARRSCAP